MKLATKLILSFLLISVVSIGLVVGATRLATDREFDSFIDKRYKAEMADELAWYYRENNSFDGVENGFGRFGRRQGMMHGANREPSFFITDPNGIVIVSDGMMHPRGEQIGNEELTKGTEIVVDSQVVGILFVTDPMMRSQIDFAFLRSVYRSIFLSAAGTTLLALIIGVLISRSITRPVSELTHATHKMADGALGEQVPVRSRDEIGDLANSFNKMSADLARSFELRKQMTADIAHELRTPISLILGHAEGVKDGV
ncbi:MAG: HAMP domain-containing protein, partial [Chloroflexi bacterium CFX2]|nr:HAMP domain-containing protein [Chloroflexi bacterium CFX2]